MSAAPRTPAYAPGSASSCSSRDDVSRSPSRRPSGRALALARSPLKMAVGKVRLAASHAGCGGRVPPPTGSPACRAAAAHSLCWPPSHARLALHFRTSAFPRARAARAASGRRACPPTRAARGERHAHRPALTDAQPWATSHCCGGAEKWLQWRVWWLRAQQRAWKAWRAVCSVPAHALGLRAARPGPASALSSSAALLTCVSRSPGSVYTGWTRSARRTGMT